MNDVVDLGGETPATAGNVGAVLAFIHELRTEQTVATTRAGSWGDPITVARAPLKYS